MPVADDKLNKQILKSAYIGGVTGIVEYLFTHPIWVLKTRKQCNYPFTLNPFVLYKGITFSLASSIAISPFQIGSTIVISERLSDSKNNKYATLSASVISGAAVGFIHNPFNVIMVQQQKDANLSAKTIQRDLINTAIKIKMHGGYRGFFCGAPLTSLQYTLHNYALFIATPNIGKEVNKYTKNHTYATLLSGSISGFGLAIVTHPLDTIEHLQQDAITDDRQVATAKANPMRLTAFEHAKKLYRLEGVKGFYRGFAWTNAQVVVGTAAASAALEYYRPSF